MNNVMIQPQKKRSPTGSSPGTMQKPQASLVIAVYNRPEILEKVFLSLLGQSFANFEIVIADDGSGPEIVSVIDRYKQKFLHPVQHVWQKNEGFRKTIIVNKSAVAAKSDYLIFIDGDCLQHHRFFEFHLKRRKKGTVLAGRRVMLDQAISEKVTREVIAERKFENIGFWWNNCRRSMRKHGFFLPGAFWLRNITKRKKNDILGSNFSVYKDDFLSINGYDERIIGRGLEDDNLSARFTMANIRIKTVAHEALQYHLHHSSNPIPHSTETIKQFRDFPDAAWTPFGIVKEPV